MNLNIKIPAINDSFWVKSTDIELVKNKLVAIKAKYNAIIQNVSLASNVPVEVIVSVIFIESAGNQGVATTGSEKATGLMQVSPATAYEVIKSEIEKKGRLSAGEKTILTKYGINTAAYPKTYTSAIKTALQKALAYPEFNILVGSMNLRILMDLNTEGGTVRLDKVIVQYNAGFYYPNSHQTIWKQDINNLYKNLNSTTKSYVLKFIGKNGTLDILV